MSNPQPVQRTIVLSAIQVAEGFNPRSDAEHAELARLAESIKTHGVIQPLLVTPAGGTGDYRLIDGERRYRACLEAAVTEVPVLVRDSDQVTEALDVALVANMQRGDLSPLEEAERVARREQREAEQEARRAAVAYNDELGAAVVKHLGRVKVDPRVIKILAAVDFGGDLDKIATRGARYGIPGFEHSEQLKSGKTKRAYLQAGPAAQQARTFLANAGKAPGDLAGRMIALAAMARYANEDAVAQSSRSFSELDGGGELPWSLDFLELLDELAAERLPAHLLDPGRPERQAQAARRREVIENRAWLAARLDELAGMDPERRANVAAEAVERFGDYTHQAFQVRERVRELDAADQHAGAEADDGDREQEGDA